VLTSAHFAGPTSALELDVEDQSLRSSFFRWRISVTDGQPNVCNEGGDAGELPLTPRVKARRNPLRIVEAFEDTRPSALPLRTGA
jgi:hypothetical protein